MTAPHRLAPAFQLEVRAPFLWPCLVVLCWSLALLALGAALVAQVGQRLGAPAALGCWAVAALFLPGLAWWAWRLGAGGVWQLLWDGQRWGLRPGPVLAAARRDAPRQAVEVQVAVDFDGFLLLRCRPVDAVRQPVVFLPLLRRQHPSAWRPLRWALFSARELPPEAR